MAKGDHKTNDRYIFDALMKRMKGLTHNPQGCASDVIDDFYVVSFDGMEIVRLPYYTPFTDELRREGAIMEMRRLWNASREMRPLSASISDYIERTARDLEKIRDIASDFELGDLNEYLHWDGVDGES